jgi:hypothetical protein
LCLELGLSEGVHEKYIGTIFSRQQKGFKLTSVRNPIGNQVQTHRLKTDRFAYLKEETQRSEEMKQEEKFDPRMHSIRE